MECNAWFKYIGFTTIRIPYWLQLSNEMIAYKFGINVDSPMCTLKYSIFDSPTGDYGLSVSPLAFSYYGCKRFVKEWYTLPSYVHMEVRNDLFAVAEANGCVNDVMEVLTFYADR